MATFYLLERRQGDSGIDCKRSLGYVLFEPDVSDFLTYSDLDVLVGKSINIIHKVYLLNYYTANIAIIVQ